MIKEIVNKAYDFAKDAHSGQVRKFTNLPYFSHPKYVARIIEDLTDDPDLVASSLLHDTIEDTPTSSEDIHRNFGDKIGDIVDELTSDKPRGVSKRKYLTNKISGISTDAFIIKLADRLHNVMFLQSDGVPKEFIHRYVKETHYILRNTCRHTEYNCYEHILFEKLKGEVSWLSCRYRIQLEDELREEQK